MGNEDSAAVPLRPTIPPFRAVVGSPVFTTRTLVLAAGGVSEGVFLLSYLVALGEGFTDGYLGAVSPDYLAAELELIEARRRSATEIDTWSYNLPTLLPFLGSGLATTVTWFVSFTDSLSRLLV